MCVMVEMMPQMEQGEGGHLGEGGQCDHSWAGFGRGEAIISIEFTALIDNMIYIFVNEFLFNSY